MISSSLAYDIVNILGDNYAIDEGVPTNMVRLPNGQIVKVTELEEALSKIQRIK